jgi:hypothetical protein
LPIHGRPIGVVRRAHMAAQKREAGKNYIGLLSDELEAPYAGALPVDTDRPIRNYVLGLMANFFRRRSEAR